MATQIMRTASRLFTRMVDFDLAYVPVAWTVGIGTTAATAIVLTKHTRHGPLDTAVTSVVAGAATGLMWPVWLPAATAVGMVYAPLVWWEHRNLRQN